jgi:acyl-ACP thioesterase
LNKHCERFEIYFHDADRTGHASLLSVCRYLLTAAVRHGKHAGTSIDHFAPLNLTWVYSRFHVQMISFPRYDEVVFIDTWRSAVQGCFAFRDYTIRDAADNLLGAATSSSALIDKLTRKPVAIPDFIQEMIVPGIGRVLNSDFGKLPEMPVPEYTKSFPVRISDIDINDHVSNISYLAWIIEGLPSGVLLNLRPYEIEIEYRAEVIYGQSVISESARLNGSDRKAFVHRLIRESDGKETNRARTAWR